MLVSLVVDFFTAVTTQVTDLRVEDNLQLPFSTMPLTVRAGGPAGPTGPTGPAGPAGPLPTEPNTVGAAETVTSSDVASPVPAALVAYTVHVILRPRSAFVSV